VFDREDIERKIGRLEREENAWQEFFRRHDITPHRVSYEGLAQAPDQHVRELLEFLGQTLPADFEIEPPVMERQTDELSEEWVARYLAESGRT
jgi:LPS sulfotransferase NodH